MAATQTRQVKGNSQRLWKTLDTGHAMFARSLLELLKEDVIWKKRSPLGPLPEFSETESNEAEELVKACKHATKDASACKICEEELYRASRALIDLLADSVEKNLMEEIDMVDTDSFGGSRKPTISLNDYMFRCVKYMDRWFHDTPGVRSAGMRSLLCALVYISRMKETLPEFCLNPYNSHRMFMVTMLLAAKFSEDKPISNVYWSRVGGVHVETLNRIESQFCTKTDYQLFVDKDDIEILYEEFS